MEVLDLVDVEESYVQQGMFPDELSDLKRRVEELHTGAAAGWRNRF
jgi:hypothetical protein